MKYLSPENFLRTNVNAQGQPVAVTKDIPATTYMRLLEKGNIESKANDLSIAKYVSDKLTANVAALKDNLISRGIEPADYIEGIILQSALERIKDIAYASEANNLSNADAVYFIDQYNQAEITANTPDSEFILPADLLSNLDVVAGYLMQKAKNVNGTFSAQSAINEITGANNINGFDVDISSYLNSTGTIPDSYNGLNLADYQAYQSTGTGSDFGTKIFDFIDKVTGTIDKVSTSIGNASTIFGQSIENVKGSVQGTASDVTSQAFSDAIQNNLWIILLMIGLLGLIIFLAVRQGNK